MRYLCSLHYRNNKITLFKLGISPNDLKLVDLTPLYKKKDLLNKEKYHPVSGLSYFPEIFEKIVYKQISSYMEPSLIYCADSEKIIIPNLSYQKCLNN